MKWGKIILVIFGAIIITALGIDAADTLNGNSGTLLSQVIQSNGACPQGMVAVNTVPGIRCADQYEVSAGTTCPNDVPSNMLESIKNVDTSGCGAVSIADKKPWSFVTRDQARDLCARSGKRLPTASEWYALSLGMTNVEASCNINGTEPNTTGNANSCATPWGGYDLVGNVWEWVSDDVTDGVWNNRTIPESGYVTEVDSAGVATGVAETESPLYGEDYFWGSREGTFGMIRGGFYGSGSDGGIYAVHANTKANSASAGVGFRCVQ